MKKEKSCSNAVTTHTLNSLLARILYLAIWPNTLNLHIVLLKVQYQKKGEVEECTSFRGH